VAFRVPILVKRKRSRPASSSFDIYLEADDSLRKAEHHFIRRGITIPDIRANGDKPVRALIIINDQSLSTFLGDAENPAHSDWSERADKIRTQYDHGPTTVRFVKNGAGFLASLLARPPAGRVRDFLADLFSVEAREEPAAEEDTSSGRMPVRGAGDNTRGTASAGTAIGRGGGLTIARIAGGFTIKSSGHSARIGRPLHAEVAYRVRAGNPFRKHSPFDFDLLQPGGITIRAESAEVRPTGVNAFELTPTADAFQISMKGFDPRRDLVVRVVEPPVESIVESIVEPIVEPPVESNDAAETQFH
jgi:hypothetical protein